MALESRAIELLKAWYHGLRPHRDGLPARGAISASLIVLEHLKQDFDLEFESHLADGGAQLKGVSPKALLAIMSRYGETRPLSKIAGRSNRKPTDVRDLLEAMRGLGLSELPRDERNAVLEAMQQFVVQVFVSAFHNVEKVKVDFDPTASTSQFISKILAVAKKSGKDGCVAEHLVAAKLQLRFPNVSIRKKSCHEADSQYGFDSDVEVGDTTFHVTVAPMPELYEKVRAILLAGKRVYILVPSGRVEGTRQNAEAVKVAVESIESFIATNVDELAQFDSARLKAELKQLLGIYNQRIADNEVDHSLQIELPPNL